MMKQRNYKREENSYQLRTTCYRLIMFILLAITIGSCYSIEPDCDDVDIPIVIDPDPFPKDGFWEYTGGPPNVARAIAVASNGDIWTITYEGDENIYVYTVYLSTDNGNTWVQKYFVEFSISHLIAVSPANGSVFVGTLSHGLFRSTDRGENWIKVTNDTTIGTILITESGEIYFGTYGSGVYYSNNNGNTWIQKNNGLFNHYVFSLASGKDGTLYAGTNNGIYRSTNRGDSWLLSSSHASSSLTVSNDGSIFAATDNAGVLKSIDRGVTWIEVNTGLDVKDADYVIYNFMRIIYNPITNDIFFDYDRSLNFMVYRSTNLGESWELENSGLKQFLPTYEFACNSVTGQMYLLCPHGVYRSRNYPE